MTKNPLFFESAESYFLFIEEVGSMQEAFKEIKVFCDKREYKIHYVRYWIEQNPKGELWQITFDVGSWSEFFHIYFESEEQANAFRSTAE